MVFNIPIDNTDDHEKNPVLLMTDAGAYCGVSGRDLDSLAQQIDRPFLADQRQAWRRRR